LYTLDGDATGGQLGVEVFFVGDVDADGCPDFAAGSWGDYVRVWSGADGSVLYTFTGNAGDLFGRGLAGAGDVNADGYDDILVGAPKGHYVAVYSGRDGSVLYAYTGTTDGFGWSVTGLGDTDGDGYDDFAIGARYDNTVNGSKGAGAVYVKSGKDGSVLKNITESTAYDFGNCVSPAGDVNADGVPDLLVADRLYQAFVYSEREQ
jgi:hypothetical protein